MPETCTSLMASTIASECDRAERNYQHVRAGNGKSTTAGDGGLAQNAGFSIPRGLLFDTHGDLFISDVADNRIREVLVATPAITVAPSQMNFSAQAGGLQDATPAAYGGWTSQRPGVHD